MRGFLVEHVEKNIDGLDFESVEKLIREYVENVTNYAKIKLLQFDLIDHIGKNNKPFYIVELDGDTSEIIKAIKFFTGKNIQDKELSNFELFAKYDLVA